MRITQEIQAYGDLISQFGQFGAKYMLIAYGVLILAVVNFLFDLNNISRWIEPVMWVLAQLILGAFLLGGAYGIIYLRLSYKKFLLEMERDIVMKPSNREIDFEWQYLRISMAMLVVSYFLLFTSLSTIWWFIDIPAPIHYYWPKEMLGGV